MLQSKEKELCCHVKPDVLLHQEPLGTPCDVCVGSIVKHDLHASRSSGMVLETDERIWHRFVETGTMHVLVVSAEIQNLYIFLYIHVLYFLI